MFREFWKIQKRDEVLEEEGGPAGVHTGRMLLVEDEAHQTPLSFSEEESEHGRNPSGQPGELVGSQPGAAEHACEEVAQIPAERYLMLVEYREDLSPVGEGDPIEKTRPGGPYAVPRSGVDGGGAGLLWSGD